LLSRINCDQFPPDVVLRLARLQIPSLRDSISKLVRTAIDALPHHHNIIAWLLSLDVNLLADSVMSAFGRVLVQSFLNTNTNPSTPLAHTDLVSFVRA